MFSERAPRPSPSTPVPARRASPHHTVRCKRCQARCASSHGGVDADRPARRGHQDAVMRCHADSDPVRDVAALAAAPLGRSDLPCRVGRRRRQGGVPDRPPAGIRRPASVSQASKAASSRASAFLSHHPDWLSQDLFVTHPRTVAPPKPDRSRRRPTASHGMYAGRPESNAFPSADPVRGIRRHVARTIAAVLAGHRDEVDAFRTCLSCRFPRGAAAAESGGTAMVSSGLRLRRPSTATTPGWSAGPRFPAASSVRTGSSATRRKAHRSRPG